MATAPVKSQPLHNFPLSFLKWSHRCRRPTAATAERRRSPLPDLESDGGKFPFASCSSHKLDKESDVDERRENIEAQERGGKRKTEERVWNLRPRRVKVVAEIGGAPEVSVEKSATLTGLSERHVAKRKDLLIALSREEIEEDMYAMTGGKPARRPKKRPKTVQKQLDSVFPGLYLVGITAKAYRVDEDTK